VFILLNDHMLSNDHEMIMQLSVAAKGLAQVETHAGNVMQG
jgi:hypothetical protein